MSQAGEFVLVIGLHMFEAGVDARAELGKGAVEVIG